MHPARRSRDVVAPAASTRINQAASERLVQNILGALRERLQGRAFTPSRILPSCGLALDLRPPELALGRCLVPGTVRMPRKEHDRIAAVATLSQGGGDRCKG